MVQLQIPDPSLLQPIVDENKGEEEVESALAAHPPSLMGESMEKFFQLSHQEDLHLKVMARRWSFSSTIAMLNLFGVDLYNQIQALTHLVDKSDLVEIISSFALAFFSAYQTYDIDKNHPHFPSQFIFDSNEISIELKALSAQINKAIQSTRSSKLSRMQKRGASRGVAQLDKLYEGSAQLPSRIHDTVVLFLKIFQHSQNRILVTSKLINQDKHEDVEKSLKDITIFLNYCHALLEGYRQKGGLIALSRTQSTPLFFQQILGLLSCVDLKSMDAYSDLMRQVKQSLHASFGQVAEEISLSSLELNEVCNNELTRESWIKRHKVKIKYKQTHEEFIQYLNAKHFQWINIDFLLSQCEHILDVQLILPKFPCFSPIVETRNRFLNCMAVCPSTIPEPIPIDRPICCPMDFNQLFCEIIAPIESLFAPVLEAAMFEDFKKPSHLEQLHSISGGGQNAVWLYHLQSLASLAPLLTRVKNELAQIPVQLLQRIQTQFDSHEVAISQKEKEVIIDYIQNVCFQQSLFIARMIMIMEDASTFLNGRFSLEYAHLPAELVNIMQLSGVEECIKVTEARPAVEENEVRQKVAKPVRVVPAPLVKKQKPQDLAEGLRMLRKTHHIIQLLKQHQFYKVRSKGSHFIFKGPDGRIVPVPNHPEQPLGTLRNIIKQATAPSRS